MEKNSFIKEVHESFNKGHNAAVRDGSFFHTYIFMNYPLIYMRRSIFFEKVQSIFWNYLLSWQFSTVQARAFIMHE